MGEPCWLPLRPEQLWPLTNYKLVNNLAVVLQSCSAQLGRMHEYTADALGVGKEHNSKPVDSIDDHQRKGFHLYNRFRGASRGGSVSSSVRWLPFRHAQDLKPARRKKRKNRHRGDGSLKIPDGCDHGL